jgi:hypothetical protein
MGVSGRAMLKALSQGEREPEVLASLAQGRLRAKHEELVESLEGELSEHQQWLLERMLQQVEFLEAEIRRYDERVAGADAPF